jgi:peptide/nickel transport system permease protein
MELERAQSVIVLNQKHGKKMIRRFFRHRSALIGSMMILFLIMLTLIAPLLTPYTFSDKSDDLMQAPSWIHWFGTDEMGRDLFTRVLFGARISLWIGFVAVSGSLILGSLLGLISGYFGGKWDTLISRLFDIMLAFPGILLAIAIVTILGPGLNHALIAISIINIPIFGRLMRSSVLRVKAEDYILSAQAIGASTKRIIFRHVLPNCWTPLIVQGTLSFATAVIEAAALGFLGLGAEPPLPEWGTMLADSRPFIQTAPWLMIFPGVFILFTVLGFNLIGDGLRDIFSRK